MVDLTLTDSQYRDLLRLVYLGNMVANGGRPDDEHVADLDELEQTVFSLAKAAGHGNLVSFDRPLTRYFATLKLEEDIYPLLSDYDDSVFWEGLAHRLATRELEEKRGQEAVAKLTDEQYAMLEEPRMLKYWEEFKEHGIDRLRIVEK